MDKLQKLFESAKNCRINAYAPYSEFKVGAAILGDDGNIYVGCNVENASYPCGTCAEAGAIAAMVASGCTEIKEILIIADTDCILPCGNCMQKIKELGDDDTLIHSADLHKVVQTLTLSQLMPVNFKAEDLKNAR